MRAALLLLIVILLWDVLGPRLRASSGQDVNDVEAGNGHLLQRRRVRRARTVSPQPVRLAVEAEVFHDALDPSPASGAVKDFLARSRADPGVSFRPHRIDPPPLLGRAAVIFFR